MKSDKTSAGEHPFLRSPHYTIMSMSFPVLLSLIAEPLTGLVDTAFVARLGSTSLAALGVGTVALSGIFWIFAFLGVGTQTEVSQAFGRQEPWRAKEIGGLSVALGAIVGFLMLGLGSFGIPHAVDLMGATGAVHAQASQYLQIRLFGAPAVLITIAAFGIFRGLQDMRSPLWIAASVNALNIILDPILIYGFGPIPALEIVGAALASSFSQWVGAAWAALMLYKKMGIPDRIQAQDVRKLLQIGRDMFIRTGSATIFFVLTTRAATRIGPDAGAAHQAVRQVWIFTTLLLDAFAITGQSLVGYFVGPRRLAEARRVAYVVCCWGLGTGLALCAIMVLGKQVVTQLFVPPTALQLFIPAWMIAAVAQPVNSLTFATDGIHWGTGDFPFLRNAMLFATICGIIAISLIDLSDKNAFTWIWLATAMWIMIRTVFGITRIWPGFGGSPLRQKDMAAKQESRKAARRKDHRT